MSGQIDILVEAERAAARAKLAVLDAYVAKPKASRTRPDDLLRATQVAKLLGVSDREVRRKMDRGELGFVLVGKLRQVPEAEVVRYQKAHAVAAKAVK